MTARFLEKFEFGKSQEMKTKAKPSFISILVFPDIFATLPA